MYTIWGEWYITIVITVVVITVVIVVVVIVVITVVVVIACIVLVLNCTDSISLVTGYLISKESVSIMIVVVVVVVVVVIVYCCYYVIADVYTLTWLDLSHNQIQSLTAVRSLYNLRS